MTKAKSRPQPSGVMTIHVWAADQISRVERTLTALALVTLTIEETERLERAIAKGHARNLLRVEELIQREREDELAELSMS